LSQQELGYVAKVPRVLRVDVTHEDHLVHRPAHAEVNLVRAANHADVVIEMIGAWCAAALPPVPGPTAKPFTPVVPIWNVL
jgi:hypothetical protein